MAHPVQVKVTGGAVQQGDVLDELVPPGLPSMSVRTGSSRSICVVPDFLALVLEEKCRISCLFRSYTPKKSLPDPMGQLTGYGVDAQFLFDLLTQGEGVAGFPVHFVDEGKNGDIPHDADFEQLPGLCLHALGAPSMTITAESAAIRVR